MDGQITYSTLGSCVTRDIFRVADKEKRFRSVRNVGFVSPFSLLGGASGLLREDAEELGKRIEECSANNFCKRNVLLDLKKQALDYLISEKAEYLILDIYDIRLKLLVRGDDVISVREGVVEGDILIEYLTKRGYTLISPFTAMGIKKYLSVLKQLCGVLTKYWNPEKIILIGIQPVKLIRRKDGILWNSPYLNRQFNMHSYNRFFNVCCRGIKDKLKCHFLSFPHNQYVMADENHTLGVNTLHYTDRIYEYLYDNICLIALSEYEIRREEIVNQAVYEYYTSLNKRYGGVESRLSQEALDCTAIDNLTEYLDYLSELRNCLVIIAIKDTAGGWLDETIQEKLHNMGLVENLIKMYMVGYIALIKNGIVIYEKRSEKGGCEHYNDTIDYYHIDIESKPFKSGNKASIYINRVDYAVDSRGLNIVVLDLESGRAGDSVAFDTHTKNHELIRRTDFFSDNELMRVELNRIKKSLKTR